MILSRVGKGLPDKVTLEQRPEEREEAQTTQMSEEGVVQVKENSAKTLGQEDVCLKNNKELSVGLCNKVERSSRGDERGKSRLK